MHFLTLTKEHLQTMIDHVDSCTPLEACGLLAGKNSTVGKVIGVRNQAQSPGRFVMDPIGQLAAFQWIESHQFELLGIFHSHPTGPETVSPTDIAEAAYSVVHVILAPADGTWRARGFWVENGGFEEVTLNFQ